MPQGGVKVFGAEKATWHPMCSSSLRQVELNTGVAVPRQVFEVGSTMPTLEMKPRGEAEPELNLLLSKSTLEEPLWKSLFQNLDEFFFPKKLPPLVLTSKPVPVKDIWGFYDYKKNGVLGSTVVHMLAIAAIIGITLLGRRVVQQIVKPHVTLPSGW